MERPTHYIEKIKRFANGANPHAFANGEIDGARGLIDWIEFLERKIEKDDKDCLTPLELEKRILDLNEDLISFKKEELGTFKKLTDFIGILEQKIKLLEIQLSQIKSQTHSPY